MTVGTAASAPTELLGISLPLQFGHMAEREDMVVEFWIVWNMIVVAVIGCLAHTSLGSASEHDGSTDPLYEHGKQVELK